MLANCTRSSSCSGTGAVTRCPFRYVPLVLPRSRKIRAAAGFGDLGMRVGDRIAGERQIEILAAPDPEGHRVNRQVANRFGAVEWSYQEPHGAGRGFRVGGHDRKVLAPVDVADCGITRPPC